MKVTQFTREALAVRREYRDMPKDGWEFCREPLWKIIRGERYRERIVEARPSVCGKHVWLKTDRAP